MYKIVYLGTPDFAVDPLKALISDSRFEVVCVVSQPDKPAGRKLKLTPSEVSSVATENGLKLLRPNKSKEIIDDLKALKADCAVVVAYGQILSQAFIDIFPKGAVNLHGSLLPHLRGAAPIQRALTNGDAESGVCLQKLVKKLDAGAVIAERRVKLTPEITAIELYDMLKSLGSEILVNEFVEFLDGKIEPVEQDESLVTYADKIEKDEGLINWSEPALKIHNLYRGLKAWPGVWTIHKGKRLKLTSLSLHKIDFMSGTPGTIVKADENGLLIQCKEDAILITEVQPESRSKMSAGDFIRGYKISSGDKINE